MTSGNAISSKNLPGIPPEMIGTAKSLVAQAHANDGLAPLDVGRFWDDQAIAVRDPFGAAIPQAPLGIAMSWECVFDELGLEEDPWRYLHDAAWRRSLITAYNDRSEQIVGRRLLDETPDVLAHLQYPERKELHDVFEMPRIWQSGSWWLEQSARTEDELTALLDRVDNKNIRQEILPPGWEQARDRLLPRGIKPPLYRAQRGPVTFATSLYGTDNLLYLIMLNPDLAARLRDTILRVMLEIGRIGDEEAGYSPAEAPRGFSFYDDNCSLLSPELYEFFSLPILRAVFENYAPAPCDWRYQHSDSAMGHLVPLLSQLNFTQVNFGPTVTVAQIRHQMPRTVIQGQLAPFTFSRNNEVEIVTQFLRDFTMAGNERGLLFDTAGSVNNGSRLTGMRLIMAAIQRYGRYH